MKQTLPFRLTSAWEILRGLGAYNLYHSSNTCYSYLVREDSLLPEKNHTAVSSPREIAYLGDKDPFLSSSQADSCHHLRYVRSSCDFGLIACKWKCH